MASFIHNPFAHDKDKPQETPSQEPAKPDEQSLTTILSTHDQRAELTLLLATCTALMRKPITDIFDPRYAGKLSDSQFDNPLENKNLDLSKVNVEEMDKEREEAEKRIKELSEPEMQGLKKAALAFFDAWRDSVLGRVGQILNGEGEAKGQKEVVSKTLVEKKSEESAKTEAVKLELKSSIEEENKSESELVTEAVKNLYPPVKTPLADLDEEKRKLILHSLMLLLLSLEHYAAHSRILLLHMTSSLNLSVEFLTQNESATARTLIKAAEEMNADKDVAKKADENQSSRKWKVGLATVAGAALIGVTGGLAAPLLAAGLGSMMGGLGLAGTAAAGYLGTVAGSTVVVGSLFGAYGGRMTGKMMDEYAKEVQDFGFLPIRKFSKPRKIEKEYRRLRVAIGISGWLTDKEEVIKPWRVISPSIEGFALKYEMEALLNLGNSMTTLLKSQAWALAKKEIIRRTIFAALTQALWPLGLLKVARIIDNPFTVAKTRSDKAGQVLADAIINKAQGERPVSLIGYSLGARVIYTCLVTLAERKAFGLIESVVLLGAPAPSDSADWRKMRSVVSGRLVNVYSENDYILGFLYRTSSIQYGVAGLRPAEFVRGVENIDVSDIVDGHLRYRFLTGTILKKIGFEDLDLEEVEQERMEAEELEELEERQQEKEHGKGKGKDADEEAKDMEKEVEKKNEQNMMDWATGKLGLSGEKGSSLWSGWGGKEEGKRAEAKGDEVHAKSAGTAANK
ncbi:DUF726-domain-containing protein [Tothia fuscella]|uniref:DUF726-domain-containing protein n=1 Tax=Tothia fuscella TaxID=1048955 RepID=A0A9P4NYA2_9PEZI|nr:DUF726-domain-containing protein [Tothia fuscella]